MKKTLKDIANLISDSISKETLLSEIDKDVFEGFQKLYYQLGFRSFIDALKNEFNINLI